MFLQHFATLSPSHDLISALFKWRSDLFPKVMLGDLLGSGIKLECLTSQLPLVVKVVPTKVLAFLLLELGKRTHLRRLIYYFSKIIIAHLYLENRLSFVF